MITRDIKVEIAKEIAANIKAEIAIRPNAKSIIVTSYALHLAIGSIAKTLEVDIKWFKVECGIGQPLAYFI